MVLRSSVILLIFLTIHLPIGCSTHSATRQDPLDFSLLNTHLQRGISTQEEVKQLFGDPNGFGDMQMLIPGNPFRRKIWFYADVEVKYDKWDKQITMEQGVLLIFMNEERYDGYWWFSHATKIQ